ncbi:MAG: von Willebrand factor type A domain-containing protein [Anaerolineae bacterium]
MRRLPLLFVLIAVLVLAACSPLAASPPNTTDGVAETQVAGRDAEAMEEPMDDVAEEDDFAAEAGAPPAPQADAALPEPQTTATPASTGTPAPEEPVESLFQDYGTNPFTLTEADNLSTFAIDVDTGSYTIARSYLNRGTLPPPDSVRLEEYINFFPQDYPLPQEDAFLIDMEGAPTPFSSSETLVMRVGVQGFDVPDDQRPDANLIFVIDVSGSMDGPERLGAVKEALFTLVDNLRDTDQVGIVVYGSRGRILLELTPVAQTSRIITAIDRLESEGSTNAEEGLRLAYEMATANYDEDRINRLILLSDGVANVGATGPDTILETVRVQAREGITLTTVGFGMGNFNDVLMEQLANDGDGQYFYVDGAVEAARVFVNDLTGTLLTIARAAKIQVEFNPQTVEAYRLMGYENRDVADEDFRNDEVDAGEIGAGHAVTALYEVVPVQGAQGVLATARLRWEDPASGQVTEIEQAFSRDEVHETFEEASATFRLSTAVAAFADLLSEGACVQNTDFETVHAVVRSTTQDAVVLELLALIDIAASLSE